MSVGLDPNNYFRFISITDNKLCSLSRIISYQLSNSRFHVCAHIVVGRAGCENERVQHMVNVDDTRSFEPDVFQRVRRSLTLELILKIVQPTNFLLVQPASVSTSS